MMSEVVTKEKAQYFKDQKEWRAWLTKNHDKEKEVWLLYYKKHTDKPTLTHMQGVEEALCFGWIDSVARSINNECYMQRYSPRRDNSVWSKINKDLALKLIKEKKVKKSGMQKIEIAKIIGTWQTAYTSLKGLSIPPDLENALNKEQVAIKNFNNFANSYRNIFIGWVESAKTKETRTKRLEMVFDKALKNEKNL
jgi:uncharacterized protein YdeI (YjbR/CyaY-like superfamily)